MKQNLSRLKRSLGWFLIITANRLIGRAVAPDPYGSLFIETTGHCNLACRFCSYDKRVRERTVMNHDHFARLVTQAADAGYRHLWLTPQTGDVFTDRGFLERIAVIEASAMPAYSFYTNLIGASAPQLDVLAASTKLKEFHVSLYGETLERFQAITKRQPSQFDRLLANLDHLIDGAGWAGRLKLTLRTGADFSEHGWSGPLAERVRALVRKQGATFDHDTEYDSWGGLIGPEDVSGLGVEIRDGSGYYKRGVCIRAIGSVQVMADGSVNACACRDPMGALTIGDTRRQDLSEIVSPSNSRYADLLSGMNRGIFPDPCVKCSMYRSIYDPRWTRGYDGDVLRIAALSDLWGQ